MQATGLFVLAVFVGVVALVVFSAAWFVAIPLAFLFLLVPVGFLAAFGEHRSGPAHPTGSEAMPSSGETAYEPVVDPATRRTTSR